MACQPGMRAFTAVVLAGCWQSSTVAAPPPPAEPAEPARMIVGHVELGWDGEHLKQAPGTFARFESRATPTDGLELALVGCVGLLGRARLTQRDELGWHYEVTTRASQWTPMRTCPIGEIIQAFAVSPPERVHDGARGEVDVASVYATLPIRFRAWHESFRKDRELALWADVDDDDTVDLVELLGRCDPFDTEICTVILSHDQATWRRVGGSMGRI